MAKVKTVPVYSRGEEFPNYTIDENGVIINIERDKPLTHVKSPGRNPVVTLSKNGVCVNHSVKEILYNSFHRTNLTYKQIFMKDLDTNLTLNNLCVMDEFIRYYSMKQRSRFVQLYLDGEYYDQYIVSEKGFIVNALTHKRLKDYKKNIHGRGHVSLGSSIPLDIGVIVYSSFHLKDNLKTSFIGHRDGNRDNVHIDNLYMKEKNSIPKRVIRERINITDIKVRYVPLILRGKETPYIVTEKGDVYNKTTLVKIKTSLNSVNVSIPISLPKSKTETHLLKALVYRSFHKEDIHVNSIGFRDGDPTNCSIDNLYDIHDGLIDKVYKGIIRSAPLVFRGVTIDDHIVTENGHIINQKSLKIISEDYKLIKTKKGRRIYVNIKSVMIESFLGVRISPKNIHFVDGDETNIHIDNLTADKELAYA